jgi:biopolymer transport protein ExbB
VAAAEHLRNHSGSETLGGTLDADEFVTRALRKSIALSTARLESGLTVLASIGSTAPFVGLFGTVWGIYGALIGISASGMATLDAVAGPVGEALIMTAFGLFVAIPAVLAYNGITRANRLELSELDAFAHDLHAWFATGARIATVTGAAARTADTGAAAPTPAHGAA